MMLSVQRTSVTQYSRHIDVLLTRLRAAGPHYRHIAELRDRVILSAYEIYPILSPPVWEPYQYSTKEVYKK